MMQYVGKILLVVFLCAEVSARDCLPEAQSYLHGTLDTAFGGESETSYKVEKSESHRSGEETLIYSFIGGILDSWDVEVLKETCEFVGVQFAGDY